MRTTVTTALVDAGVYLDDARFDRARREVAALAGRHLRPALLRVCRQEPDAVAASLGLALPAIRRMFGHGWQQAAGFGVLAGVRAARICELARLGAMLNLAVVLVDHVVDTLPERRELVPVHLHPDRLAALVDGGDTAATGDPGINAVVALAAAVLEGAQRLGGRPDDAARFRRVIAAMYEGEMAGLQARRVQGEASALVWESLQAKSALPATTVATLAVLAEPAATDVVRAAVDRAAALVGEMFWIVDDLADVAADWDAGSWSRPLWLLEHRTGEPPADARDAVRLLLESGTAAEEAQRIAHLLRELASLPGVSQRALLRPVQAAVRSWVEEIPADP